MSIEIVSKEFAKQELDYIPVRTASSGRHSNPVVASGILPKIIWIIIILLPDFTILAWMNSGFWITCFMDRELFRVTRTAAEVSTSSPHLIISTTLY